MSRDILDSIINDFDSEKFARFFREKNRSAFAPRKEELLHYDDEDFKNGLKLGEIAFTDAKLFVCTFQVSNPLSERSGKKAQYEKAKKILKIHREYSAGIFIFYDANGNFRFSLIYDIPHGNKRDWSNFRRFTYFVSKEFTNKTFLKQIGESDFSSLEKIKEAFSVEKVTKEFYEDIANWYFWAVKHSTFPKDAEVENGRNIAVIRLITRIIFIWFMREKENLVPNDLFKENKIKTILKDISSDVSTYYKAVLQNLFFATLSTKKNERDFRNEKRFQGKNKDFGNQYVYRYHGLFSSPDEIKTYFGKIPFLNGGLFECLDDGINNYYVDGFTERKEYQPIIPNFLFFGGEQKADLNTAYGTKNKTYKVRGLLNILSSFNFTIDENSPDDQDIALDPELLGRVFENLLASFNPETSTTARKATGSYYTPREIVDYMVSESLKAYFKTHLSAISDLDKKIEQLFSTGSEENPFDKSESKKIVELIESVRIVDPAVGSGAFPMGALNKLVFILNKVDPGNELWKHAQLSAADTIPDPRIKQDTKNRIEEFFKGKNADYGRKLYLIQKCIYGVDIQQIAVEIAKLRFFISLLVDEKIDRNHPDGNWGIEPLPNLDFKIMQGNSLLEEYEGVKLFDEKFITSIDFDKQKLIGSIKQKQSELQKEYLDLHAKNKLTKIKQAELNEELKKLDKQLKGLNKQDNKTEEATGLFDVQNEAKQKREMLKRLHKEFFETNEKETKEKIKKQIEKIGWDLIEATLKEQDKTSELKKIEQFKKSNTKPFFLWKLHFADVFENGGFDIVIANPPYIGEKGHKEIFDPVHSGNLKKYYQGQMDLFYFFFHLALNLGKQDSSVAFITTNYYPTATGARNLRIDLSNRATIKQLINFGELKIFESALGQHNMITIFQKENNKNAIAKTRITKRKGDSSSEILQAIVEGTDTQTDYFQVAQGDLYDGEEYYIRLAGNSMESNDPTQSTINKIKQQGVLLSMLCNVNVGLYTGADKVSNSYIQKYSLKMDKNEGIFIITREEMKMLNLNSLERSKISSFYKNSDIFRWHTKQNPDLFLINISYPENKDIDLKKIPNIFRHVSKYEKILRHRKSNDNGLRAVIAAGYWWSFTIRQIDFNKPKIVVPQRSPRNTFGYNEVPWYASADVYFITEKDKSVSLKYILALLNSKLYYLWLYNRGKRKGETLELYQQPLSEIPIKKISLDDQKSFIEIVDKILLITKAINYLENPEKKEEVKEYERQIDQMVYKLYGLTEEEVALVEAV